METDEKVLTGEESLKIITEMISKTKVSISQGSFHLLFWGWLILVCSLSEYLLYKFTDFANPWYVWLFVIPGVFVSMAYGFIKGRKEQVLTYATTLYVWTWMAFMVSAIVLFVLLSDRMESVGPHILTIAAIPTFVSGFILKFRPLIVGGISFWIFALVGHFGGADLASLSMPVAMLTGYLIPGYMLRRRVNHDAV